MQKKDPFILTDHLQWYYKNLFETEKQIDSENPADICGLCLYVEYVFRFLGTYELEVDVIDTIGWDKLIDAFEKIGGNDYVQLLKQFKQQKDDSESRTIFMLWKTNDINAVFNYCKEYMSKHIDSPLIEKTFEKLPPISTESPLLIAARICDLEQIEKHLQDGCSPNIIDESGYTPLGLVMYEFRDLRPPKSARKCLSALIQGGSAPDCGDNKTLIHDVIYPPEPELLQELLDYGWDINYTGENKEAPILQLLRYANPKEDSFRKGDDVLFSKCLEIALEAGPDCNVVDPYTKLSPLCLSFSDELTDKLMELGAQIEVEAYDGLFYPSPLVIAVFEGDTEKTNYWINKGADVNLRLAYRFKKIIPAGSSVLDIAQICQHKEIIELLVNKEAKPGEQLSWLVKLVAFSENVEIDKDFYEKIADFIYTLIKPEEFDFELFAKKDYLIKKLSKIESSKVIINLVDFKDENKAQTIKAKLEENGLMVEIG